MASPGRKTTLRAHLENKKTEALPQIGVSRERQGAKDVLLGEGNALKQKKRLIRNKKRAKKKQTSEGHTTNQGNGKRNKTMGIIKKN